VIVWQFNSYLSVQKLQQEIRTTFRRIISIEDSLEILKWPSGNFDSFAGLETTQMAGFIGLFCTRFQRRH